MNLLQTIQLRLLLPHPVCDGHWMWLLRYVAAPAGSGCLTREAAAVPTGTQGTENISAAFGDRSSFVGHGSSAAGVKNNHLVLHLEWGLEPHKHPEPAPHCQLWSHSLGAPTEPVIEGPNVSLFDMHIHTHSPCAYLQYQKHCTLSNRLKKSKQERKC